MKKSIVVIVALVAVAAGWYAFRPERLFVNQTVNEPAPAPAMTSANESAMSAASEMAMASEAVPMKTVSEPMMSGGPTEIASGTFHDGSHETRGKASIYRYADGRRVLRLTGFHTSNGPDVQVLLVAAMDAKDNESVTKAGYVHVGALKGNIGDQNYELPSNVDLAKHQAVTIWCRRFGVNFGTAPLAVRS
jgi:hypothetical protein